MEVSALLQIFLRIRHGFLVADHGVGAGRQHHSGGDGRSSDDGEQIEVHGNNPRRFSWLACRLRP